MYKVERDVKSMRSNDIVWFLRRFGKATTLQVARHLEVQEPTAEAMLALLRDEGKVYQLGVYWFAVCKA